MDTNSKTLDLWVILGTLENVGSFAHVFEEDPSGLLYVSDVAFVSDGERMYPQRHVGVRVIQKDKVLAEDVTEEQYKRIIRLMREAKKARNTAVDACSKALKEAKSEMERTQALINDHYEKMFYMVLDGAFDKACVKTQE